MSPDAPAASFAAQEFDAAVAAVRSTFSATPTVGVVLGSGLGAFGDTLETRIPYESLPGMPRSTVVGHAGNLCLGRVGGVTVACLQGRVHGYEGHPPSRVVFGVRLLARLGCRAVLLTNAAGGIRGELRPGELMLLRDHLNLTGSNPLVGPNDDAVGPRFPDLSTAYDAAIAQAAREAAKQTGGRLREGVYAAMLGPSYETPSEVKMLRTLGADAVGMSTVSEVIALRHMGVRVGAISCITNLAAGISKTPLDHREVEETARRTRESFVALLERWIVGVAAEVEP